MTVGTATSAVIAPEGPPKRLGWDLRDPKGQSLIHVRVIRDDIHRRVKRLLETEGWERGSSMLE